MTTLKHGAVYGALTGTTELIGPDVEEAPKDEVASYTNYCRIFTWIKN